MREIRARNTDDSEGVRQKSIGGEMVERGHEQTFREIARGAEDDENTRVGVTSPAGIVAWLIVHRLFRLRLDMAAEAAAHRREQLVGKTHLLPRAEPGVERRR